MRSIFREFTPFKDILQNDPLLVWMNVVGGLLIGISFIIIGISFLMYAEKAAREPGAKIKKTLNQMIGLFLATCGFSRMVDVFCTWHNIAYLSVILKLLTGIISCVTLYYIPRVIRLVKQTSTLDDVNETLQQTKNKIERLQESTDKLTGGTK